MDSTVLLYDLLSQGHKIHALLFDYGQRHLRELEFARLHCERNGVFCTELQLPDLRGSLLTDGQGTVVIPNRNAILLSCAANIAIATEAQGITFAANRDDEAMFPDCRKAFLEAMNAAIKAAGYDIAIEAPYIDKPKSWIAAKAAHLGLDLSETWSCYHGGDEPCGVCLACEKRNKALGL